MKALLRAVVLFFAASSPLVKAETPVYFADPNLKAAVEAALEKTNPTPLEMLGLTSLDASSKGITNLNGLEYATNLTFLILSGNKITDISPLARLNNLSSLYLFNNNISDILPLAQLTKLERLILVFNRISDISPLSGLKYLKELGLAVNPIIDISQLAGLENLEMLNLAGCEITDISPLVGLENLVQLELNANQINDILALTGLRNLIWLNLNENRITNLSALTGLTNLQTLWLGSNQISDIQSLSGLRNLNDLLLSNNHIRDISELSVLINLKTLQLSGNPLNQDAYDIYIPLIRQNNPGITIYYDPYDPGKRPVSFADPNLKTAVEQTLSISNPTVSDMLRVTSLFARNKNIVNLTGLEYATNLWRLYLEDNHINDISVLSGLTKLGDLYLYNNQISDIAPLSGLRNLMALGLTSNPLNADTYSIYIPLICQNNPGITLYYDPPSAVQIPTVSTLSANVGRTIATLRGHVDRDGGQVCEYRFKYKEEQKPYIYYTAWNKSVTTGQLFSQTISGLTPEATYYFNAQLRNSAGQSEWGNEQSLTTVASILLPSDFQAVEGFSSILSSSHQASYNTYRGQATHSHWEYAGGANESIEWRTACVPSSYTKGRITFIWSGANGIGKGYHDLYLNGIKILTFTSDQTTDYSWRNGNYELFFNFKNHNADNAGVYYLTVPTSVITAGNVSTIKVESGPSEANLAWFMVHDFADTIEYEMSSGQLDLNHIGRANEMIVGDCSDGIQNGDETGIDCGGSCVTTDTEVCNGRDDNKNCLIDEDVKFTYGHYYVIAALCLSQNAKYYVRDVNDIAYPVLVDVLGFAPEIDMYIVDFTLENFPGGFYTGLGTIDGVTGGNIALWDEPIRNLTTFPRNMCYDLLYETIHGLTAPLKYNIQTYAHRHGVIGRGEDFDIIFEVEALYRLGATDCMNELYAVFYSNESFPHFPVYYDIRQRYGWEPIKKFLNTLNQIKDEIHVDTDDQECYYMSISVREDVSTIYEAHHKTISQETKNRIKSDLE